MATDRDFRQKQHHNARPVGRSLADGQRRAGANKERGTNASRRRAGSEGKIPGTGTSAGRSARASDTHRGGTSGKRRPGVRIPLSGNRTRSTASGSEGTARTGTRSAQGSPRRNGRRERNSVADRTRQMNLLKIRLGIIGGIIVAVIVWYSVVAAGYRSKYLPNTYINGFDVSGMSSDYAEQLLKDSVEDYLLEIGFRGGKTEAIRNTDINLTYVSSNEAAAILKGQKRAGWIRSRFGKVSSYSVQTSFQYDKAKLKMFLEAMPEFQAANITSPRDAHVVRNPNGTYRVAEEFLGNEPDEDVVINAVNEAVNASAKRLSLYEIEGAYKEPKVKADDAQLTAHAEKLNKFITHKITINRKDNQTTVVDSSDITNWVSYDEETDTYSIDDDTVYDYCYGVFMKIAKEDNDIKTVMKFKPRNYAEVTLPCADYGYELDLGDEAHKLFDLVTGDAEEASMEVSNAIPTSVDPTFGGNYVEVDVTNQKVYIYKNGETVLTTDCVTGTENYYERRTPSGVFSIVDMERDRLLSSSDPEHGYSSPVSYWMPFFGSYGMHDADWRDEDNFGGEIYTYAGSHGCVNLPPSIAGEVYDTVEIFMPVVVCREGDNAPEGTERGDVDFNAPEGGLIYT